MSDLLIKGTRFKKPKSCFTHGGVYCPFHVESFNGKYHACTLTGSEVKCDRLSKDCPLVEYPTDFLRSLAQDLERLSDKVHELSQDYMSNELYDVHTDMAECIESMRIAFGKEASE